MPEETLTGEAPTDEIVTLTDETVTPKDFSHLTKEEQMLRLRSISDKRRRQMEKIEALNLDLPPNPTPSGASMINSIMEGKPPIDFGRVYDNEESSRSNLYKTAEHLVTHPIDSALMLGKAAIGMPLDIGVRILGDTVTQAGGPETFETSVRQLFSFMPGDPVAMGRSITGSIADRLMNPKKTIEEDPYGVIADIFTLYNVGASAGARAGLTRSATKIRPGFGGIDTMPTIGQYARNLAKQHITTRPMWNSFIAGTVLGGKKVGELGGALQDAALGVTTNLGPEQPKLIRRMAEESELSKYGAARSVEEMYQSGMSKYEVFTTAFKEYVETGSIPQELVDTFKTARRKDKQIMNTVLQVEGALNDIRDRDAAWYVAQMEAFDGHVNPTTLVEKLEKLKGQIPAELEKFHIGAQGRGKLIELLELAKENRAERMIFTDSKRGSQPITLSYEDALKLVDANIQPGTYGHAMPPGIAKILGIKPQDTVGNITTQYRPPKAHTDRMDGTLKVGEVRDAKGNKIYADGAIAANGQRRTIREAIDMILAQEKVTVRHFDELKQGLDSMVDKSIMAAPNSRSDVFISRMRNIIADDLADVTNANGKKYSEVTARHEMGLDTRKLLVDLYGLSSDDMNSKMSRLLGSLKGREKAELREMWKKRVEQGLDETNVGETIAAKVAGFNFGYEELVGTGLIGKGLAAAGASAFLGFDFTPETLTQALGAAASLATVSPVVVGEMMLLMGYTKAHIKNVVTISRKMLTEGKSRGMVLDGLTYEQLAHRMFMSDEDRKIEENNTRVREEWEAMQARMGMPIGAITDDPTSPVKFAPGVPEQQMAEMDRRPGGDQLPSEVDARLRGRAAGQTDIANAGGQDQPRTSGKIPPPVFPGGSPVFPPTTRTSTGTQPAGQAEARGVDGIGLPERLRDILKSLGVPYQ